ncbi:MAG TPA: ribose 5-phosphate isomerase B [Vicinamibacterales bacterium]|nr:ribose 5-phosphate isomerase B [Vicinamibacterales bacterium]
MKIAIASDHAGYAYKSLLVRHLGALGHDTVDFGTSSTEPVDYPDFIHLASAAVATGQCERGIVLGGSGNGEAMAANRHPGVRCALCWNEESARLARSHNDANMISIGERMVSQDLAPRIVDVWLTTEFEGGRHVQRIQKLNLHDGPIDTLVRRFFAAFDNRAGAIVDLPALRDLFVPGAIIVRKSAAMTETWSVSQFLEPRQALLTDGSLADFHEWEVDASTFVFGDIACRTLRYGKEGRLHGAPFGGDGTKSMHFVRTDGQWRITSIIWQDSEPPET